jgi:hypothetical protein
VQVFPFAQQAPLHRNWPFAQQTSLAAMPSPSFRQFGLSDGQHCFESVHQRVGRQQVSAPPVPWKQVSPDMQHLSSSGHCRAVAQQVPPLQVVPAPQQTPLQSAVGQSHVLVVVLQVSFAGQLVHVCPQSLSSPHILPLQLGLQHRSGVVSVRHCWPFEQQAPLHVTNEHLHMSVVWSQVWFAGHPLHTMPQLSSASLHAVSVLLQFRVQQVLLVGSHTCPSGQHAPPHRVVLHLHMCVVLSQVIPVPQLSTSHVPPQPSGSPHCLPVQVGVQQALLKQFCPPAQQSPLHVNVLQTHVPFWQTFCGSSSAQEPLHFPVQPSESPHFAPTGQFGTHSQVPLWHASPAVGQVPLHFPLHPSLCPHTAPVGQLGVQTHWLLTQVWGG